MKFIRKGLIWVHRYLGIALSLLFVVWFVSGIGMMFAGGMPRLNPRESLYREHTIDLSQIKFTPSRLLGEEESAYTGAVSLRSLLGRPVYHIDGQTMFADDGTVLESIDKPTALKIAGDFMGANVSTERMQHTFLTEGDQWTLTERRLPLHKI